MQTGRHFLSSCSEVNSTGYPEFDEPISARHQRYPLFWYILMAHSRSFLANQKARNAIFGAENLLIHICTAVVDEREQ